MASANVNEAEELTRAPKQKASFSARPKPNSIRSRLTNSLGFACVECIFTLGEYILVLLVITTVANGLLRDNTRPIQVFKQCVNDAYTSKGSFPLFNELYDTIRCLFVNDIATFLSHTSIVVASTCFVLLWMGWRCLSSFATSSWLGLPRWLGLTSIPRVSFIGALTLIVDLATFCVLIWMQQQSDRWFMSFSNYLEQAKQEGAEQQSFVKYSRVIAIILADPFKEEFIFRGCIYYLLYRRSKETFQCVFVSSAFFGLFHLLNLLGTPFSAAYVCLQVFLGFEIGSFFSMRFLISGTLWEPILLHSANNLLSGFLPVQDPLVLQEPVVMGTLTFTVVVYGILNVLSFYELKRKLYNDPHKKD